MDVTFRKHGKVKNIKLVKSVEANSNSRPDDYEIEVTLKFNRVNNIDDFIETTKGPLTLCQFWRDK